MWTCLSQVVWTRKRLQRTCDGSAWPVSRGSVQFLRPAIQHEDRTHACRPGTQGYFWIYILNVDWTVSIRDLYFFGLFEFFRFFNSVLNVSCKIGTCKRDKKQTNFCTQICSPASLMMAYEALRQHLVIWIKSCCIRVHGNVKTADLMNGPQENMVSYIKEKYANWDLDSNWLVWKGILKQKTRSNTRGWITGWWRFFHLVIELNLVKCHKRFGCLPWGKHLTLA